MYNLVWDINISSETTGDACEINGFSGVAGDSFCSPFELIYVLVKQLRHSRDILFILFSCVLEKNVFLKGSAEETQLSSCLFEVSILSQLFLLESIIKITQLLSSYSYWDKLWLLISDFDFLAIFLNYWKHVRLMDSFFQETPYALHVFSFLSRKK